nr:DUF488 family protein [Paenibacillus ihuae]
MPERIGEFSDRYIRELEEEPERERLAAKINERALKQQVTLVYAAKDSIHNHAAVLYKWLLSRYKAHGPPLDHLRSGKRPVCFFQSTAYI